MSGTIQPRLRPAPLASDPDGLALALGGGGARAAYQVGVFRSLARRRPHLITVYRTDVAAFMTNAFRWVASMVLGGPRLAPRAGGPVDTVPGPLHLEHVLASAGMRPVGAGSARPARSGGHRCPGR